MRSTNPTAPSIAIKTILDFAFIAGEVFVVIDDASADVLIGDRIFGGEALHDGADFDARGLESRMIGDVSVDREPAIFALLVIGGGDERLPDLGLAREVEAGGHHADDGGRLFIDAHGAADYGEVLAIAIFPDLVAEDGDGRGSGLFVGGRKIAAGEGLYAEQGKRVGGDAGSVITLGRSGVVADIRGNAGARADRVEGF